jgi:hypothetical protein
VFSVVTVHGFDFTPGPFPDNHIPKCRTARFASTADSDFSSKASSKREGKMSFESTQVKSEDAHAPVG